MLSRIFSVAVVGSLVLALSSVALALPQKPVARLARMKSVLALTDQQANEIRDLLKNHQQAAFPLRQELRARNYNLWGALDAPEPNANTIGQLVIGRRSLRNRLLALNVKLHGDIAAKLTPEQKTKMEQMKRRTQQYPRTRPASKYENP